MAASAHLLRTLASVAPGTPVVDLAAGGGRHLVPLARLGLDVRGATDRPEDARAALADVVGAAEAASRVVAASPVATGFAAQSAAWAVLEAGGPSRRPSLAEAYRVLEPGGWVWVETDDAAGLEDEASAAGLVVAQAASSDEDGVHAIFRRPGAVG